MPGSWFHRPLESPRLYDAVQRFLGAGDRTLGQVYARAFGDSSGTVLDVGCGPVQETPLPAGALVGLDVNPAYVARYVAAAATPRCALYGIVASAAALPVADGAVDESRCVAVLHHLPEDLAAEAVREMVRVVRRGGRVLVLDMVRPPRVGDGPLASLLCALDRGRHVRSADDLAALLRDAAPGEWREERFTYAWPRLHGALWTRNL